MKGTQFKVWTFFILFFVVVGYFIFALTKMADGDPAELCTKLQITIADSTNTRFLKTDALEELLTHNGHHPIGKHSSSVNTADITETLLHNKFVKTATCYVSNNGMPVGQSKVCITVTERTPILYILPDNTKGYYIDEDGVIIPNTVYATNILTATGQIDQVFATNELAPLGTYIATDAFWNNQIEQIYVSQNHNDHIITLVPRVGGHTITLGHIQNYEKKLRRLQVFYKEGLPKVGWNKYSDLNLEYDNQVVCTKK